MTCTKTYRLSFTSTSIVIPQIECSDTVPLAKRSQSSSLPAGQFPSPRKETGFDREWAFIAALTSLHRQKLRATMADVNPSDGAKQHHPGERLASYFDNFFKTVIGVSAL